MNMIHMTTIVREGSLSGRIAYLLLPVALCMIFTPGRAFSACSNSGDPVQIVSSCDDLSISNSKSSVTISPSATVSPFFAPDAVLINPAGTVTGNFLNQGTITSGFGSNAFKNQGSVSAFINEGTITNGSTNTTHAAILNNNEIGTLTNKGIISATVGSFGAGAQAILQSGHIGTLDNSGTISAQNRAIYFTPGITARIDTLINSGTIPFRAASAVLRRPPLPAQLSLGRRIPLARLLTLEQLTTAFVMPGEPAMPQSIMQAAQSERLPTGEL